MIRALALASSALFASHAAAQLYAITFDGFLFRINTTTGASTFIGGTGLACNAATGDSAGRILTTGISGPSSDQIIAVDPVTAAISVVVPIVGRPTGYSVRGMAMSPSGTLFVTLSLPDATSIDTLASINMSTGVLTVIGPTNQIDIQGLAFRADGALYAVGVFDGGRLFSVDSTTGIATLIGAGGFGFDEQAIEILPDGSAFVCRAFLRSIDLTTGVTTIIGNTGQGDIRGLAYISAPTSCYPNCDGSTSSPLLTANDFQCFLNKFAAQDPYANCDASTGTPTLTANDFQCFLNKFAAGCS